jgi:hypothetical protein
LTQIHADKEKRYLHNSEPNRFDIISQKSLADKIAFPSWGVCWQKWDGDRTIPKKSSHQNFMLAATFK